MKKEAMHYIKMDNGDVLCQLCPHNCRISEGKKGVCGVRVHRGGTLVTTNYGEISSFGFDPIEKKPLYHYKPGTYIASVGSFGCNFDCGFCQNHSISRSMPETRSMSPEEIVKLADSMVKEGNIGIAFTYNEPSIWYEYVKESACLCRSQNMDVILVTNGFINRSPLTDILPYVNGMNIDLKAFNGEFYRRHCKGELEGVMDTIQLASSECHVEITTLLIGGYNDKPEEIEELCKWLASINIDIPLHLSRYHPDYKFTAPPTSIESIKKCAAIAKKYLHHVYIGNIRNVDDNTYCYRCGEKLIERSLFDIKVNMVTDKCPKCEANINIVL